MAATLAASAALHGLIGATAASGTGAGRHLAPADLLQIAAGAHTSLMKGDIAAHRRLIALTGDFTFMGPFGGKTVGTAGYTDERWAEIGRFFRNGSNAGFELVQSYYAKDLAVLVAIERANVEVGGLPAQDWSLRVTLVFKREQGEWRLAHRHADPLVRSVPLLEAAKLANDADEEVQAQSRGAQREDRT